MALVSGTRLGPYEILSPIGAGGMGIGREGQTEYLVMDVAAGARSVGEDVPRQGSGETLAERPGCRARAALGRARLGSAERAFGRWRDAVPPALSSGFRLGPYEILAPIGARRMGEVYKARDTRLERAVAVKLLSQPSASS